MNPLSPRFEKLKVWLFSTPIRAVELPIAFTCLKARSRTYEGYKCFYFCSLTPICDYCEYSTTYSSWTMIPSSKLRKLPLFLIFLYSTFSTRFSWELRSNFSTSSLQFSISWLAKSSLENPKSFHPLTPSAIPKLLSEMKYASSQLSDFPILKAPQIIFKVSLSEACSWFLIFADSRGSNLPD